METQVRTIMCGCGMCQFRKNASDLCPQGNSKDAIQLWASDFSRTEDTEDTVDTDTILEELANVAEELNECV